MKINTEPKLDFDDVLLVPQRTRTASRSAIDLERKFTFYHSTEEWHGVPIVAANMDTTGTFLSAIEESRASYDIVNTGNNRKADGDIP